MELTAQKRRSMYNSPITRAYKESEERKAKEADRLAPLRAKHADQKAALQTRHKHESDRLAHEHQVQRDKWSERPSKPATLDAEMAKERHDLVKNVDPNLIWCRGLASAVMDKLVERRNKGLSTFKQARYARALGHPAPETLTFAGAAEWINSQTGMRAA